MGKLVWILLMVFCLVLAIDAKKKANKPQDGDDGEEQDQPDEKIAKQDDEEAKPEDEQDEQEDGTAKDITGQEEQEEEASGEEGEESKEFQCNLKFKRVGCYADKGKKNRPLKSFIMSDMDMGLLTKKGDMPKDDKFNSELPKFACKCANEALNSGNAVFGIQNIAECWSGPDNSKYDKDGQSGDCVTFDYQNCASDDEICAGKKHSNFVYYVDTPEHTKSAEEVQKELAAAKKKAAHKKKQAMKKKAAKKLKKKSKKSKQ
ncbi:DNA ligase 1-like [Hydractinia symbiolongicarpus]|uniref:DNA ligase 1-like n=1 Tax=Hydractinia symbiolongicarpus TaxID=13093 RepID=UPI00254F9E35|nr:DNA ligase 1-like [Hydractinia symbiolongicarpus]XP_057300853.1 DNA ligase 1-like [Hydractinia symbiolongicarpus]